MHYVENSTKFNIELTKMTGTKNKAEAWLTADQFIHFQSGNSWKNDSEVM